MSLENAIEANTKAIEKLIEVIQGYNVRQVEQTAVAEPVMFDKANDTAIKDDITYKRVKELINQFALTHRAAIKQVNMDHGLAVFSDILRDTSDPSKGVKDQDLLERYYTALMDVLALKS